MIGSSILDTTAPERTMTIPLAMAMESMSSLLWRKLSIIRLTSISPLSSPLSCSSSPLSLVFLSFLSSLLNQLSFRLSPTDRTMQLVAQILCAIVHKQDEEK
jgi:hypothetical protein